MYPTLGRKIIIVFFSRFFSTKRKILRLEEVYDHNFLLIYVSTVEQKDYAISVEDGAFNLTSQLMRQIIEKILINKPN